MEINKRDLWRGGIQLQESGKVLIAKKFIDSVKIFFIQNAVSGSRCAAFCLNVEDKRKELSHKLFLENVSTF